MGVVFAVLLHHSLGVKKGFSHTGGWRGVVSNGYASDNHRELIIDLQRVHDSRNVDEWAIELRELAIAEGLQYNGEQYE